jgi:hypothetical protein
LTACGNDVTLPGFTSSATHFHIFQRAVFLQMLPALRAMPAVGIDIVLGDGNDESIDIAGHGNLLKLVEES